jgi:hypothetical protein
VILLTFAHRGEASRFLKLSALQPIDSPVAGFYRTDTTFLLITEEGLQNATEKVSAVLGAFHHDIKGVINLGIAGALDDSMSIGEIYPVRVCYCERNGSMEFRSFPTTAIADPRARDCVSINNRALDMESRKRLEPFASCVDREAWAIGSVCAMFGIPFSSYKLISDRVGEGSGDLLESIKNQSHRYSEALYDYYNSLETPPEKKDAASPMSIGEDFYLTTSQRRRYRALMDGLRLTWGSEDEVWRHVDLEKIRSINTSAKARTSHLLDELADLLNPINKTIRHKLAARVKPLTDEGHTVQFSEGYQDDSIHLTAHIDSAASHRRLIAALESISIDDIQAILNGDIDG